jgi:thiol-disulfide isomerase/thioredoxin
MTLASPSLRFAATICSLAVIGCGSHGPPWGRGQSAASASEPRLFAILLNGGGTPRTNYFSHARHVTEMYEALTDSGLDEARIEILASDGESRRPDLAVSKRATGQDAWLLEGTFLERPLFSPTRYVNTRFPRGWPRPAGRRELEASFKDARKRLRAGDSLLLFVTDHGERGKTPEDTRITLWDRESITVGELGALLAPLPPGARVVMVMSQCFSGAFAELALAGARGARPAGSVCGYFATTADRMSYGCYSESRQDEDDGHAFRMIRALRRTGSLAEAHAETLIADRTPDVPLRSSDVYLGRLVERMAQMRQSTVDQVVASRLTEILDREGQDESLVRQIAQSFAIPVPRDRDELDTLNARIRGLRQRLEVSADVWADAVGELAQSNMDAFLAAHRSWEAELAPRRLDALPLSRLEPIQAKVVKELAAFTAAHPQRFEQLRLGRVRRSATHAAASRSNTRRAALLRLHTLLVTLAGRHLLEQEGRPEERAELEALRACEDLRLPRAGAPQEAAPAVVPFPSLDSDERLALGIAPVRLGAALTEVPAEVRRKEALSPGAVQIVGVDPQSPAAAAGLRPGDVVLGSPGAPVQERGAMKIHLAASLKPPVSELEIHRNGRRLSVLVPTRDEAEPPKPDLPAAARAALGSLVSFRGSTAEILNGRRPFLLFFWATWCKFCKDAVPELLALEQRQGIRVVAITDEERGDIAPFLRSWRGPFPATVALDPDRRVNEAFQIDGYPTFVHVDENGRVRMRSSGYRPQRGLPIEGWAGPEHSAAAAR